MLGTADVDWEVMAQTDWLLWCDKSRPWLSGIRRRRCCMAQKSQAAAQEVSSLHTPNASTSASHKLIFVSGVLYVPDRAWHQLHCPDKLYNVMIHVMAIQSLLLFGSLYFGAATALIREVDTYNSLVTFDYLARVLNFSFGTHLSPVNMGTH